MILSLRAPERLPNQNYQTLESQRYHHFVTCSRHPSRCSPCSQMLRFQERHSNASSEKLVLFLDSISSLHTVCNSIVVYACLFVYLLFYVPLKNFSLIWREGPLSCHTYFDTGPRIFRSHPKDRPIKSPLTTR
jgi:hypothetical protein